jgi:PAS domain S-box-containing protein
MNRLAMFRSDCFQHRVSYNEGRVDHLPFGYSSFALLLPAVHPPDIFDLPAPLDKWYFWAPVLAALLFTALWVWMLSRKVAEKARDLEDSEENYRLIIEHSGECIVVHRQDQILFANNNFSRFAGVPVESLLMHPLSSYVSAEVFPEWKKPVSGKFAEEAEPERKQIPGEDGSTRWIELQTGVVEWKGQPATLSVFRDVSSSYRVMELSIRQFQQIAALRAIDQAIVDNLPLEKALHVVMEQVRNRVGVDACRILLPDAESDLLVCTAYLGFHSLEYCLMPARHGDGSVTSRAAETREIICISDRLTAKRVGLPARFIKDEKFNAYGCVPLVSKGELKGILEIYNRSPIQADAEWFNFLTALAVQCAIVIDVATLFKNLQASNWQLKVAYDATIEGWAKALELRDGETVGHSERVTRLTVQLARLAGIEGESLLDIYRGALLHDIGKMAIPDSILLNKGSLTEEEWKIMRLHPGYSLKFLSGVDFLKTASDIPYCHHEWWDGSGYPQRLKGEQIPLAARIFSIVDVFDALTSDRPYRLALPREVAEQYIKDHSGKQFDPSLVDLFFKLDLQPGGVEYAQDQTLSWQSN